MRASQRLTEHSARPRLNIEPRDLITVVGNLVDNALDAALAAPAPRVVEVAVRLDGDDLLVQVADSGPGLAPQEREQAFIRGWSTKGDGPAYGPGLGLGLVGQVVDRHGGSVDVGGERGAVFTVGLPILW